VTLLYRAANAARARLGPPGRLIAAAIFWATRHGYGCSIAATSRLHGGLILPHPQGIVVGANVEVGPRAWIFQNVTIGGTPGRAGAPRAGADARFYAGAVVAGPVRLGDDVVVGANAVVTRDVPSGRVVRPAPVEASPAPRRDDDGPREEVRR
jgi:serine O-acetyltransferase